MEISGDIPDKRSAPNEAGSPLRARQEGSPAPSICVGDGPTASESSIVITVPQVKPTEEFPAYIEPVVKKVIAEEEEYGSLTYLVRFKDGATSQLQYKHLLELRNGADALARFQHQHRYQFGSKQSSARSNSQRVSSRPVRNTRLVNLSHIISSSDDELSAAHPTTHRNMRKRGRPSKQSQAPRSESSDSQSTSQQMSSDEFESGRGRRARGIRKTSRAVASKHVNYSDALPLESESDGSQVSMPTTRKRRRISLKNSRFNKALKLRLSSRPTTTPPNEGTRRSERTRRVQTSMMEVGEDFLPENESRKSGVRAIGAKEQFQPLPDDDEFRMLHCQTCDACDEDGDSDEKGSLVYCQSCTISYHQACLGPRTTRDHLVTKVQDSDFVLQCRRCIEMAQFKDPLAPHQGHCQECHSASPASIPFRDRQTTKQEQKAREENGGEDPIYEVSPELIRKADHVLFRCLTCYRAFHMHHLPPKHAAIIAPENDERLLASSRHAEYSRDWQCKECSNTPGEVDSLVAWRPLNEATYPLGTTTDEMAEDAKQYLVKWKNMSFFRAEWMSGPWVWGVTPAAMRKAFARRDDHRNLPKMTREDAIPEEYLRVDIVLDVQYTNAVQLRSEKVDKARIKEVKRALVKLKGLGYEDVVWEEPPTPDDADRWADFQSAYDDWVMTNYIHLPLAKTLGAHLIKIRTQNFQQKLEMKDQPESLKGGKLMEYQLQGLNWLYYQWHRKRNAILADEMGLGKTIQIIGFLTTLKHRHGCWPFLIVVPNSTCANWRRETKQWAPSLRVVTYFGSAEARRLAVKYELFPGGGKNLHSHVVVTSYEAAQDDDFRSVFRGVNWACLVVDEGQRLKNDRNILYKALSALKAPFKVLLTGTPLQNNPRELFNLLHFLDNDIDAQAMEAEYAVLTKDNVPELHDKLRPFFLRRTKAQVLTFLPPMAQIIVPVTPTVLQKKLYKLILGRNPELLKAIFSGGKKALNKGERASLSNILMQLRKCLCHPFVYSKAIEDRGLDVNAMHRNLVDASPKLKLLEIMLPKLYDRGHRVLIFSQFLDMLDMVEDFLGYLGLHHQRLDGSMNSLQKQKRIDQFNAPNSELFAFLLSTRAGGVGINLATADTVIILDPDFNPHQDIQALSRAHRIGQKKKVLVFQLTTRNTAEEKIMQMGKKKMALDHVLIEQMDADEEAVSNIESILIHGAEALFQDNDANDIRYDSASVDKLLDRSQMEDTKTGKDNSAESQFSFARIWANDKGNLEEDNGDLDGDARAPDPSFWDQILKDRENEVAEEAASKAEFLGRGKRQRQAVDYSKQDSCDVQFGSPPRKAEDSSSDTDFQAAPESDDDESEREDDEQVPEEALGKTPTKQRTPPKGLLAIASPPHGQERTFKRAVVPPISYVDPPLDANTCPNCLLCLDIHPVGQCPLKKAGVEYCNLCGIAHYAGGARRSCPHMSSITQMRSMLESLKESPEFDTNVQNAKKYLVGVIGNLNHKKKEKRQHTEAARGGVEAVGAANGAAGTVVAPKVNGNGNVAVSKANAGAASANHEIIQLDGASDGNGSGKENGVPNGAYSPPYA